MDKDKYHSHIRSDDFDVSTPHDGAIFYSNDREDQLHLNRNSADESGLTRLERTAGGSWLEAQKTYQSIESLGPGEAFIGPRTQSQFEATKTSADAVWHEASTKFARSVSGNVTTRVIGAEEDTIFRSKELPALLENQKVSSINGVSREELKALYDRDKEAAFNRVCEGELQKSREQVRTGNDPDARYDLQRREQLFEAQRANQEKRRGTSREDGAKAPEPEVKKEPKSYGQGRLDESKAARNRETANAKDREAEK